MKKYMLCAIIGGELLTLLVLLTPEQYEHLFNALTSDARVAHFDLTNIDFFKPVYESEALGLIASTAAHREVPNA